MEYSVSTLKTNTIQAATGSKVSIPGHVMQVQSMTVTTSATSAAGTTFTDTGLTVDITPTSTSSKIYVTAHVSMGATNGYRYALRLVRASSNISVATSAGSRTVATVAHEGTGGGTSGGEAWRLGPDPGPASPRRDRGAWGSGQRIGERVAWLPHGSHRGWPNEFR